MRLPDTKDPCHVDDTPLAPWTQPEVPALTMAASTDEADEPLTITKLSSVTGVNALVTGAVIEPHEG